MTKQELNTSSHKNYASIDSIEYDMNNKHQIPKRKERKRKQKQYMGIYIYNSTMRTKEKLMD